MTLQVRGSVQETDARQLQTMAPGLMGQTIQRLEARSVAERPRVCMDRHQVCFYDRAHAGLWSLR